MKDQIISKKAQKKLRKISTVIQAVVMMTFLFIGCSNLDELPGSQFATIAAAVIGGTTLLISIAFFLNDVRRWYRIVVPTYAVLQAFRYKNLHVRNREAIIFGNIMKKNRYSYSDLFYHVLDEFDETYGEPDNTTI